MGLGGEQNSGILCKRACWRVHLFAIVEWQLISGNRWPIGCARRFCGQKAEHPAGSGKNNAKRALLIFLVCLSVAALFNRQLNTSLAGVLDISSSVSLRVGGVK
jgi:hypothetical protein